MWWFFTLFRDELGHQLRRSGPWVYAGLYAVIGILLMIASGGALEGVNVGVGGSNNLVDSPYALTVISLVISLFAVMNIASDAGWLACRDQEEGSAPLVYASPVPRRVFLSARFATALVLAMIVTLGIPLGLTLGVHMPGLEPERFGSFALGNVIAPWLGWILPNVLFTTSLFFAVAVLTRRMFPNYIAGVVLVVGYLGAQALISDLDNQAFAAMIDPFGLQAFSHITQYWSAHERNTVLPWPTGWALANRVLWVAVGAAILGFALSVARLDHEGITWFRRKRAPEGHTEAAPGANRAATGVAIPAPVVDYGLTSRLQQARALTVQAVRDVLGHRYFWAFVAAAVLFELLQSQVIGSLYGTETWPVTYQVLEVLEGTLGLFVIIVITFYAGDLVWQERDRRSAAFFDTSPLPDGLPVLAKTVALFSVVVGLYATVPVLGVLVQLYDGYTTFEPGLYAQWLGLGLLGWLPYVMLAMAVHAIVNQKVLGHVVMVLGWVALSFRTQLGFEHHLLWFGSDPGRLWSDMNQWGTSLGPVLLYQAMWLALGVVLLVVARLLWVRGVDPGFLGRLVEARRRLDRSSTLVGGLALAVVAVLASVIVVQSTVLRPYRTSVDQTREIVRYERTYKAEWEDAPHPRIVDVDLRVDLYPREARVRASGDLTMVNKTPAPISRMLLSVPQDADVTMAIDGAEIALEDADLGLYVATFASPLAPGAEAVLTYTLEHDPAGFDNGGMDTEVVANGSFVHSPWILPGLGYERGNELSDKAERRKYDLPERRRMLDLDDPRARTRNYISDDADRVSFRAVVSTDADQFPLAPGAKVAERVEDGRRIVTFESEIPILYFFSFLSADWEVKRSEADGTAIEVYFHPSHTYNVDRMIEGVADSLRAFERRFSPYQYGQIRIVEFPRYAQFAQSFPSTIPFSESIGFVARIRDPSEDIDYPYYVTAHEVAHQWWAHQLIAGDGQGATVLVETLAQYSSITLMKQTYGADQVHRFLRYEQDNYFRGRAVERDREVPLMRVENQGYIHYRKGGVVMYALAEEIGQDRLDAAIRTFLEQWRDQGPPYPTARDFVDHLRAEIPDASERITDAFERIVLYQNRATSATATENADGTWTVTMDVVLARSEADEVGEEREMDFDQQIQVGVYAGTKTDRRPLLLEWRRLQGPEATVELTVSEKPTLAGIDPVNLLMDRGRDDNVVVVTLE